MQFGGAVFGGSAFGANDGVGSEDYFIGLELRIIIPVDFVFFGEIGDIIILPPDLDLEPGDMNDRRSPCILYEN